MLTGSRVRKSRAARVSKRMLTLDQPLLNGRGLARPATAYPNTKLRA
jgi:hypothetical protein